MGLNLQNLAALSIKKEEIPSAITNASNSTNSTAPETKLHNAPSQSTNLSVSLATLKAPPSSSNQGNVAAKEATALGQVHQPARIPVSSSDESKGAAEQVKTIKYQEISDRIVSLKEAIHGAHPRMPGLLQEIWSTLHSYPEQVTLLEEDQMEIIISGLEKVVDTDLAAISLKSAVKGTKGKGSVSLDSLGF